MRQRSETPNRSSEQVVRDIRRATRKHYSAEEKIRIVLDGLRGEYRWTAGFPVQKPTRELQCPRTAQRQIASVKIQPFIPPIKINVHRMAGLARLILV